MPLKVDTPIGKISMLRCIHEEDGREWIHMNKKTHTNTLSNKDIKILSNNPCVVSVSHSTV